MDWYFFGGVAGMVLLLVGRHVYRRSHQEAAAKASGLAAVADLSHVSGALQRTALWSLAEGGFERRTVHGALARDIAPPGGAARASPGRARPKIST